MKSLRQIAKLAKAIYNSDQHFVITVKNGKFITDSDGMDVNTLIYIVDDTVDVTIGEHQTLQQAKELLEL